MARRRDSAGGGIAVLTIFRVAETGSTNADMLDMAWRREAFEGDWLIAQRQSGGRGRRSRRWVSPPGNLYASTIIELGANDPPIGGLALAVGYALWVSVGDPAFLKWPNDLMIRDAKVGGILLERYDRFVVAGFGVNLSVAPKIDGRKTTSLREDGNYPLTIEELLDQLREWVPYAVGIWRNQGVSAIAAYWQSEAHLPGTRLTAELPDGTIEEGTFDGLASDGALRLRLPSGDIRVIHAGDVFLI